MFGGFPEAFFTTYFEHNPKTEPVEEFPMRCKLYESFHYLNHTLLFGVSVMAFADAEFGALILPQGPLRTACRANDDQAS